MSFSRQVRSARGAKKNTPWTVFLLRVRSPGPSITHSLTFGSLVEISISKNILLLRENKNTQNKNSKNMQYKNNMRTKKKKVDASRFHMYRNHCPNTDPSLLF